MFNVRFPPSGVASRFDAATTGSPQALGVVYDPDLGLPIRVRGTFVAATSRTPAIIYLSAIRSGTIFSWGSLQGASGATSVIHRDVSSTELRRNAFIVQSQSWGTFNADYPNIANTARNAPLFCGGSAGIILSISGSSSWGSVLVCRTSSSSGVILRGGQEVARFASSATPTGPITADSAGNVYVADLLRAQIVRVGTGGAISTIPLSTADPSTPEYTAMVPRWIHFDEQRNRMVLVTRGTEGRATFWDVSSLF